MAMNDPIADALSKIDNAIRALNASVELKKNKLLIQILEVLKKYNYVGSYEIVDDAKQGLIKVNLLGTLNKCRAVKPRYNIKVEEIEEFEQRYLPAKDFGLLLITTNKGLMTQFEAKEQNVGGAIVGYCF